MLATDADIKDWMDSTYLNPARIPPDRSDDADVLAAVRRYEEHREAAVARLATLCDPPL